MGATWSATGWKPTEPGHYWVCEHFIAWSKPATDYRVVQVIKNAAGEMRVLDPEDMGDCWAGEPMIGLDEVVGWARWFGPLEQTAPPPLEAVEDVAERGS